MALGITYSSNPSRLIQDNARFMTENLREIGKQFQVHIAENNVRKDLGAMAQEIQGMNVRSNDFPIQLIQTASRHPMAVRDERGQMAIEVLAKTHNQWQNEQAALSRMNSFRSMGGGGIYNARTGEIEVEPTARPVSVGPNSRLVNPATGETVVAPLPVQEKPFNLAPGARRYGPDGQIIAENPKAAPEITPYQQKSLQLRERAEKRAALKTRVDKWENDLRSLERNIMERRKAGEMTPEVTEWQKRFEATKELRDATLLEMQSLDEPSNELVVEPELGAVPSDAIVPQGDGGVLPAQGAVAPAASNTEFILVFDPQGKPGRVRASQLESALANGYRRR